jgi:hypothetical protein
MAALTRPGKIEGFKGFLLVEKRTRWDQFPYQQLPGLGQPPRHHISEFNFYQRLLNCEFRIAVQVGDGHRLFSDS